MREFIAQLTAGQPGLRALLVSGYASAAPDPANPRAAALYTRESDAACVTPL